MLPEDYHSGQKYYNNNFGVTIIFVIPFVIISKLILAGIYFVMHIPADSYEIQNNSAPHHFMRAAFEIITKFFLPNIFFLKSCLCNHFGRNGTASKTPAISTRKCSCQKLANPCPTLGQLLASRILYALLVGEKQHGIARARFGIQSYSKVGRLLVNSTPTPHPMGSCRGLPCNSPLATPEPNRKP